MDYKKQIAAKVKELNELFKEIGEEEALKITFTHNGDSKYSFYADDQTQITSIKDMKIGEELL